MFSPLHGRRTGGKPKKFRYGSPGKKRLMEVARPGLGWLSSRRATHVTTQQAVYQSPKFHFGIPCPSTVRWAFISRLRSPDVDWLQCAPCGALGGRSLSSFNYTRGRCVASESRRRTAARTPRNLIFNGLRESRAEPLTLYGAGQARAATNGTRPVI